MEKYLYKIIPVPAVSCDPVYSFREELQDDALRASIERHGILMPVVVAACDSGMQVVAGHKRTAAARQLKLSELPVLEIMGQASPQELFLISILSNWNQNWKEIERVRIVGKAGARFAFPEERMVGEILPCLGLKSQQAVYELYRKAAGLHGCLLTALAGEKIPFSSLRILERFSKEDQETFVSRVLGPLALTAAQVHQTAEWLLDLVRMKRAALAGYLMESRLQEFLEEPAPDLRSKSEEFCRRLRKLRFPNLAAREASFQKISREMTGQNQDLKIEAPAFFEDEGYILRMQLRKPESLDELLKVIGHKRTLLNSFFNFMV